jgi:hypothetical protein
VFHFTLEIWSPGVLRPQMSTQDVPHRSRQLDSWGAACRTYEESARFSQLVRSFLDGKMANYSDNGEALCLRLRQPLDDEEARKIDCAIREIPRKRFEGPDAPKSMEELFNG